MGRLIFVGAGLDGVSSLTLGAVDEIRKCRTVLVEGYTSSIPNGFVDDLERLTGIPAHTVSRKEVEGISFITEHCREGDTALIVPGDPMTATTHAALRIEAEKKGIRTTVIPGQSAITAVPSLLGLQIYRFGKIVSIPRFRENYLPLSPYDSIERNLMLGLHSLLLLDVDAESGYFMEPREAFEELLEMGRRLERGTISADMLACTVSRAGGSSCSLHAGTIRELLELDFGPAPHAAVLPSRLHFEEAEALVIFANADRKTVSMHLI